MSEKKDTEKKELIPQCYGLTVLKPIKKHRSKSHDVVLDDSYRPNFRD